MADVEAEIHSLASYLCVSCGKLSLVKNTKVPCLQIEKGNTIKGLSAISKHLTKTSGKNNLLGKDAEEKATVDQWVEYRIAHVDHAVNDKDISSILKELNDYLQNKVYMTGYQFTLADLVLYFGLYDIFVNLSYLEKHQNMNLSRWFDQVQHMSGISNNQKKIMFSKSPIYSSTSHH